MNDRGEKIVSLAREMLRTGYVENPVVLAEKPQISLRVLCFATFIAALGGGAVTALTSETHRPLNRYEKVELDALIFYAARLKGLPEDTVRRNLESHTGLADFGDYTAQDYRAARTYLQSQIR
ncbi:MAG: hypothetical protein AB7H77_05225 [Bdellovibrionales bacterium]